MCACVCVCVCVCVRVRVRVRACVCVCVCHKVAFKWRSNIVVFNIKGKHPFKHFYCIHIVEIPTQIGNIHKNVQSCHSKENKELSPPAALCATSSSLDTCQITRVICYGYMYSLVGLNVTINHEHYNVRDLTAA